MTPILWQGRCVDKLPVIGGTTTGPGGGGFIQMIPTNTGTTGAGGTTTTPATTTGGTTTTTTSEPPSELEVPVKPGTVATCPDGTHGGGSSGSAGQPGTGSTHCLAQKTADGTFILPSVPQTQGSNCSPGYISVGGTTCVLDISCPSGTTKIGSTQCVPNKLLPAATTTTTTGTPGTTTTTGTPGTTTTSIPVSAANGLDPTTLKPKCTSGYHFIDATHCVADSFKCPSGTNENVAKLVCEPIKAPSGPAAKTTGTAASTPSSTSKTSTTTSIVNNKGVVRGPSSTGGSTAVGTTASSAQPANNNFLNYVNPVKKITIKYPSTWTKTELVGNPSIPVIFNAPTTTTSTPNTDSSAAKTSFVINITPSTANLDSYTQQQMDGLTRSNAVKYTITNTNAKELTPPTGVTAFHEISYDGMKNVIVSNNNVPTQVPLKGAAIFFVNGGTGYSLLYLAKQNEYVQNLPMIQQMVNSFQVGTGATTANSAGGPSP
jgi:hypothetical protein